MVSVVVALALATLTIADSARCDEIDKEIKIETPKGWRGESIKLPPPFAPDMELKGVEVIRFAPGMFKPETNDFFSYFIVFRLDGQPDLSQKTLQLELLKYYRGLAKAVSRGNIETKGFSIKVKPVKSSATKDIQKFLATLQWVEPFATKKPQTLRIDTLTWSKQGNRHTWALMCVSPKSADDPIWKQMHNIRDTFFKNIKSAPDQDKQ